MSTEAALLTFLDRRQEDLLEFARALIATPSVNPPGDERAIASVVRDRLRSLGIDRVDTDPWDPVIHNGELIGLGSGDMKAAVAAMVYAAGALKDVGPPPGSMVLALVADEEAGSDYGARWLAESGLLQAHAAVIGEPCGISREFESIDLISRGAILFKVKMQGTQMHSSISDRLPSVNATVVAARLMNRMHRELKEALNVPDHPLAKDGPTVNVGVTATAGV